MKKSCKTLQNLPPAPDYLSATAAAVFEQATADLQERELLTLSDLDLIEQYAEAISTAREAQAAMREQGVLYEDKNNLLRRHPAFTVWRSATETARQLAARLTLTPYDRTRVPEQEEDQRMLIDEFPDL